MINKTFKHGISLAILLSASTAMAGQTITIDGETIDEDVVGEHIIIAEGEGGIATGNIITINDSTVNGNVIGGKAESMTNGVFAKSDNNTISITNSSVKSITGGQSYFVNTANGDSTANGNSVFLNNVTITDSAGIVVAKAENNLGNAIADNNTLKIDGMRVEAFGEFVVASAASEQGKAQANNNTFDLSGDICDGNNISFIDLYSRNNEAIANNNVMNITSDATLSIETINVLSTNSIATANNNTITLSGVIMNSSLYGVEVNSYNNDSYANNNTVIIKDGVNIRYDLWGGYAYADASAQANGNTVIIDNSSVGSVVGGYADADGDDKYGYANNNNVYIKNGTVTNYITGGYSLVDSGGELGTTTGNTITIEGINNLSTAIIYGGIVSEDNARYGVPVFAEGMDSWTGNTLNIKSPNISVKGIYNFENLNFYVPAENPTSQTMLTVGSAVDITNSKIGVMFNGAPTLNVGEKVTLIDTSGNGLKADGINTDFQVLQGISKIYDFGLITDANNLYVTLEGTQNNPQTKALSEGQAAGLAFLNQGADLTAGAGMNNMLAATNVLGQSSAFAAVGGGSSKYKTGSHVDVDGVSVMTGFAKNFNTASAGVFIEAGWGNYDSYNSFNSAASVRGDGDTEYVGVGTMGHVESGNAYGEASARVGRVKTDFNSGDFGVPVDYETSALYAGAHLGGGYIVKPNDKTSVDLNTKLFWTHQGGDDVTIAGDFVDFDSANSLRSRTGAKVSYKASDFLTPYAGAYFEYEFAGKAGAKINGEKIDEPELKGASGVGELGLLMKPSVNLPLTIDAAVQGYTGTREGISGSLTLKYEF